MAKVSAMRHETAFQPKHLDGLWQFCSLWSTGGGPICGCGLNEGHATREEAERHYYEGTLATARVHGFDDLNVQERCATCGEFTTHRVSGMGHIYGSKDSLIVLCPAHAVGLGDGDVAPQLARLRELVPFVPGIERWTS